MSAGDRRIFNSSAMLLADSASIPRVLGCTTGGDLYNFAHRTILFTSDNTLDDSDKLFTVPAGTLWWVHSISIRYTSTAIAGNRRLQIQGDNTDTFGTVRSTAGVSQPASVTRYYSFFPGSPRDTAFVDQVANVPIPTRFLLAAGRDLQVRDITAVDATGDDMVVQIVHDEITL